VADGRRIVHIGEVHWWLLLSVISCNIRAKWALLVDRIGHSLEILHLGTLPKRCLHGSCVAGSFFYS